MSKRLAKRVLLVGWDAADWQLAHPMMEAGQMPTLRSMVEGGVWGNLATLRPILSPMLWNSIATGKAADQHGICGFTEPLPDGTGVRPVSSRSRACKALWNILSQRGMTSHVVGWYASHPAEPIRGTMVSNQFEQPVAGPDADWPLPPGSVHPPEAGDRLKDLRVHPSEIDGTAVLPFVPDAARATEAQADKIGKLRLMLAQTASVHAAATDLIARDDWDFAAVYYEGIDRFGHEFMEFNPPKMDAVEADDFAMFRHAINGIYRFHDMMLDTLLRLAGPETVVILLSDHGYLNNHLRPDPATAGPVDWHRPVGVLAMAGPGVRRGERLFGASLLDVVPTVLRLLGLPVGMDMPGRPWVDALEEPLESDRIISWEAVAGDDGRHALDAAEDPESARAALQQLVDLGYVDPPSEDAQRDVEDTRAANACCLAESLLSQGRPAAALEALSDLAPRCLDTPGVQLQLALAHLAAGAYDDAERCAERLNTLSPSRYRSRLILGMLAMRRGDPEAARGHLEAVARDRPRDLGAQQRLGQVYLNLNQPQPAEGCFQRVLELDPDHAAAADGLAQCCLATGRADEAIDHALRAVELLYHFPRAHLHLGQALARTGQPAAAAKALSVCLRQSSAYHEALEEMSAVCEQLGRHREADEYRLQAAQHTPSVAAST